MPSPFHQASNYQHPPHALGKAGEDEAVRYLRTCEYLILERNWRGSQGEIDVIARSAGSEMSEVVFVEVKTRSTLQFGDPFDAITPEKYRRIFLLAREWISLHKVRDPWRIDVILLLKNRSGFELVHHRGLIA